MDSVMGRDGGTSLVKHYVCSTELSNSSLYQGLPHFSAVCDSSVGNTRAAGWRGGGGGWAGFCFLPCSTHAGARARVRRWSPAASVTSADSPALPQGQSLRP